jgi:hypothetical protein
MSKEETAASAGAPENLSEQMDRMLDSMTEKHDQNESQFHKLGEVVENEDDTGLVEVESLCMNCHENVYSILVRKLEQHG